MKKSQCLVLTHQAAETSNRIDDGYRDDYCEQARKLCLLGLSKSDIAEYFEISEPQLNEWIDTYRDFKSAMRDGSVIADGEVANGLYKRATGYEHWETKVFNNMGEIITTDIQVHIPPDPRACIAWLERRRPDLWTMEGKIDATKAIEAMAEAEERNKPVQLSDDQPTASRQYLDFIKKVTFSK